MDDREAIERCRDGEKEAFRHLVEQYQRQALGHAIAILGSREDALDAVQDAFLDAYQSLKRFDLARRFYPWFYVLLRHRCFKLLARPQREQADDLEEMMLFAPTSGMQREDLLSLEIALGSLANEDRELITLKHLDGLSYDELAERMGIPSGTVMSRLYYARKALAAKLTRTFQRERK